MGKKIALVLTYAAIILFGVWCNTKVVSCHKDQGAEELCSRICSEVYGSELLDGVCYCCEKHPSAAHETCEEVIW